MVVTHRENVRRVTQCHKNPIGDRTVFEVECANTPNMKVTDNHAFWSITRENLDSKKGASWNPISNLRVGDYIAVSSYNGSVSKEVLNLVDLFKVRDRDPNSDFFPPLAEVPTFRGRTVPEDPEACALAKKHLVFDEAFCRFLGIWYGSGKIWKEITDGHIVVMGLVFELKRREGAAELARFCASISKEYLGYDAAIFGEDTGEEYITVMIPSPLAGLTFEELFIEGGEIKKVYGKCWEWKGSLVSPLFFGMISAVGEIEVTGSTYVSMKDGGFLLKELYHLTRQRGFETCYSEISPRYARLTIKALSPPRRQRSGRRGEWSPPSSDEEEDGREEAMIQGRYFARIMKKKPMTNPPPPFVHTLGVEGDHSYNAEGLIAANCFLVSMKEDSIEGIYETLSTIAKITKKGGGTSVAFQKVRSISSQVLGTHGTSTGKIPFIQLFDASINCVNQTKRKGSTAIYIEPWDAEILKFLQLKVTGGDENLRARDIFPALMLNDLFMKRVEANENWSLFCPNDAPELEKNYGASFDKWYTYYERMPGLARMVLPASQVWRAILQSLEQSGGPYLLSKEACNEKSNHKHLGTMTCSNLCCEIIQYTSPDEIAVCTLASICLDRFLNKKGMVDYDLLRRVTRVAVRNLDNIVDNNVYPVPEAETSARLHRAVGLGIQGLADLAAMLFLPFESEAFKEINRKIMANIYYAGIEVSCEIAAEKGPYPTYNGSPMSQGLFQFDMWGKQPHPSLDWDYLRAKVKEHGMRNSLITALMPTASTSTLFDCNPCFEPFSGLIFKRRALAGEFIVVNKHLHSHLSELGLWSTEMATKIILNGGSISNIKEIPADTRAVFRTVWEISQKSLIDMAADRGIYTDQSQSSNAFIADPDHGKITSMVFYSWKMGNKTLIYYLRCKAASKPLPFTMGNFGQDKNNSSPARNMDCSGETCTSCSA